MNRTILQFKLLGEANIAAPIFFHNNVWWTRCSAQIYNEVCCLACTMIFMAHASQISDFEHLGKVLTEMCQEVNEDNVPEDSDDIMAKL
jgi:hypothetical protein